MDIKKLLEDYNIVLWDSGKNVTPGWVNIRCPFCDDNSNHGGFNPAKDYYNCWHCGWHPLPKVIAEILEVTEYEAKNILRNYESQIIKSIEIYKKPSTLSIPGRAPKLQHIKYLRKRGFEPKPLIDKYQLLGTLHESGDYGYRIIIPILYKGRMVSYQSRAIHKESRPKYKACRKRNEVVEHKRILYNIDNCTKNKLIVVEGVLDCWKIGDDCISTFGVDYTREQLMMMARFDTIFICYDPDEPGQEAAEKLSDELSILSKAVEVILLDQDPGSLAISEGRYLRRQLIGK